MRIDITTPEELIEFLKVNFDSLSDVAYSKLIRATCDVFVMGKPNTLEEAINDINNHLDLLNKVPFGGEKPIFFTPDGKYQANRDWSTVMNFYES